MLWFAKKNMKNILIFVFIAIKCYENSFIINVLNLNIEIPSFTSFSFGQLIYYFNHIRYDFQLLINGASEAAIPPVLTTYNHQYRFSDENHDHLCTFHWLNFNSFYMSIHVLHIPYLASLCVFKLANYSNI